MEKDITVEYLYDIFGRLIDNGYGNMRISLGSFGDKVFVKEDEIGFLYDEKNPMVTIRSYYPKTDAKFQATRKLSERIEKLIQKYYEEVSE